MTSGDSSERRAGTLIADAGTGAVLGLGLVAVRAGTTWLGCVLLGVALIWIGLRWVLEARRLNVKWQPFGQQFLPRVLAAGTTLAAVVGPGRTTTGLVTGSVAAGLLIAATLMEGFLARMAGRRVPVAANLPDLPNAPDPRDYTALLGWTHLAATAVGVVVAALEAPAWVWLVAVLLALIPAVAVIVENRRRIAWTAKVVAAVPRAVARYEPDLILHTAHTGNSYHQVTMWLPYLQRTGLKVLVVARYSKAARGLAENIDAPLVEAPTIFDVDALLVPSVRAVFYPNARLGNGAVVRRHRGVRHVFLGHGDSDKATSYAPSHAMYDEIFCAGPAAARRYGDHGVIIAPEKFHIVGRPQIEDVRPATGPISEIANPVVLYAPTWRGHTKDTTLSSIASGEQIIDGLLARGATVIFRPHPSSRNFIKDGAIIDQIDAKLAAHRRQTGRPHLFGPPATIELDAIGCMNAADAMISDVSGVASDFLFSNKPLAMVAVPAAPQPEGFRRMFGVANAAYVIRRDLRNLDAVLADLLGPDPMAGERARIRADYLGDLSPQDYSSVFVDAARWAATEPVTAGAPRRPAVRTPPVIKPGLRPRLGRIRRELLDLAQAEDRLRGHLGSSILATITLAWALAGASVGLVLVGTAVALAVATLGAARHVVDRRNWRRLLARSTPARAIVGIAAVTALVPEPDWRIGVVVAAVGLAASASAEPMIESAWSGSVSLVRNLPDVPRVTARPDRGLLWVAGTAAVLGVLVAALLPVGGPVLAAVLGVGLLGITAWVAVGALRRSHAADHQDSRWRGKLRKYRPRFAVFIGTPVDPAVALAAWLPYLKLIDRRFVIITHYAASVEPIVRALRRHKLKVPVVQRPKFRTVDRAMTPSMTTVFYLNNALFNTHMLVRRELNHVWLHHTWGDAREAYSPMAAMYDTVFVPGRAAIERFAHLGVRIPVQKFRIVGRPQAEAIAVATTPVRERERPTILYAPTWYKPGGTRHSSLPDGVRVVQALLADNTRVVFRPNRFYTRYPETRELVQAVYRLLEADRAATGREHLWGTAAEKNLTLTGCLNTSDALVCDGPGTLHDYLWSRKPYAVVSDGSTHEQLTARVPLLEAAYLVDRDLGNLGAVLADLRGPDTLASIRDGVRADHFGSFPDADYVQNFVDAARAIIDGGRPSTPASGPAREPKSTPHQQSGQPPEQPVDDDAGAPGHPSVVGQEV